MSGGGCAGEAALCPVFFSRGRWQVACSVPSRAAPRGTNMGSHAATSVGCSQDSWVSWLHTAEHSPGPFCWLECAGYSLGHSAGSTGCWVLPWPFCWLHRVLGAPWYTLLAPQRAGYSLGHSAPAECRVTPFQAGVPGRRVTSAADHCASLGTLPQGHHNLLPTALPHC